MDFLLCSLEAVFAGLVAVPLEEAATDGTGLVFGTFRCRWKCQNVQVKARMQDGVVTERAVSLILYFSGYDVIADLCLASCKSVKMSFLQCLSFSGSTDKQRQ